MNIGTIRLRWGILGAARVNERLMPAIVEAHNAQLVAIASRRPGAAEACLAKFAPGVQGVTCHAAPEALLEDPHVEAVYIPLANYDHAEWALRAIAHGKHVLCEKPLALTLADIAAIARAAREHKVTVMEGFMYRFHPQHTRIKQLVSSGEFGEIRSARAYFSFLMRPERKYRLEEPVSRGGGAMWDIGCYALHSLRSALGMEPLTVSAQLHMLPSGADLAGAGLLDFGEGRYAQFNYSFDCARRCEYELIGTQGGIRCHTVWQLPGDTPMLSWWTDDGQRGEERLPAANHFRLEIEHFSDCALSGTTPLLTLDDAKHNCRTILAALQSAQESRLVKLSDLV